MKKVMFVVVLTAMCLTIYGISFAADTSEAKGSMMGKSMMAGHEMKGSMMGEKGEAMHRGMMMKHMMQKEMVATPEGGVIVMAGGKLMKYDKDLNLVKEVKIRADYEAMMKNMKECNEMMKKCGMGQGEE